MRAYLEDLEESKRRKDTEDNRTYYYRHPSDPTRLKQFKDYAVYTKAYTTVVDSNFVVMEPLENWIEIKKIHLQTLMRMSEKIPLDMALNSVEIWGFIFLVILLHLSWIFIAT